MYIKNFISIKYYYYHYYYGISLVVKFSFLSKNFVKNYIKLDRQTSPIFKQVVSQQTMSLIIHLQTPTFPRNFPQRP